MKSLYTLRRRWRRRNEVKSIVSTGYYPVDTNVRLMLASTQTFDVRQPVDLKIVYSNKESFKRITSSNSCFDNIYMQFKRKCPKPTRTLSNTSHEVESFQIAYCK